MGRPPDPTRRPELMSQILDYLRDQTLAELSYRPVAAALRVSVNTLIYYFGDRESLIDEILAEIDQRQRAIGAPDVEGPDPLRSLTRWLGAYVSWNLDPDNRHLLRLYLEGSLLEVVRPGLKGHMRNVHSTWQQACTHWLTTTFKLSPRDAAKRAAQLTALSHGIALQLVLDGDENRARASFALLTQEFLASGTPRTQPKKGNLVTS